MIVARSLDPKRFQVERRRLSNVQLAMLEEDPEPRPEVAGPLFMFQVLHRLSLEEAIVFGSLVCHACGDSVSINMKYRTILFFCSSDVGSRGVVCISVEMERAYVQEKLGSQKSQFASLLLTLSV